MSIIAIDPGGITGVATYDKGRGVIFTSHFDHFTLLDGVIKDAEVIIYEKPFAKATTNIVVFQVEGVILERSAAYNKPLQPQPPSVLKYVDSNFTEFMRTTKVKKRLIHEKDALRHLVRFLTFTNTLTIEEIEKLLLAKTTKSGNE